MARDPNALEAHLFICTNIKERGECCGKKGGAELRDRLKKICAEPERGWKGRLRVNAAGCLGHCERGVAAVLYPEGRWFFDLRPEAPGDAAEVELLQAVSEVLDSTSD